MKTLFFVDTEAYGPVPSKGRMTEFGIVTQATQFFKIDTFHGLLIETIPDPDNPAKPLPVNILDLDELFEKEKKVAQEAEAFIKKHTGGETGVSAAQMVSDNPAFDFMWMADFFWRTLNYNPFGHSAHRIGDYYAGLVGDFHTKQHWKDLRVTKHTHNPVDDAMGNMEAFNRLQRGER